MRLVKGRVVAGKIEVAGEELIDGEEVDVVLHDDRTFDLTPEEDALLAESLREADEGKLIDGPAVLRDIFGRSK
jgi:hypothetical protein